LQKDNYPEYVVSLDEVLAGSDFEGIWNINMLPFISELRLFSGQFLFLIDHSLQFCY
jgi:hypothetical protein